jgi:acyl-CoA reductase-like NAD-dependent aldehyde dehydrogenase
MSTYRNFIGGEWVEAEASKTVPNLNPANTREVLGQVPLSSRDDVRRAVESAQSAFAAWRDTPAPVRGGILFKAWRLMDEERAELARLLTREEG